MLPDYNSIIAHLFATPFISFLMGQIHVEAVKACGPEPSYELEMLKNRISYEEPADSIQISIDPVGVKKQKERRDGKPKEKKREMVCSFWIGIIWKINVNRF